MKKLHFWTWAFIIAGAVVFVASSIWFEKYPNPSEYFPYVGGAIFLFILAGLVEALKKVIDRQEKLEENQREIQRWATEQEKNTEQEKKEEKKLEQEQKKEE